MLCGSLALATAGVLVRTGDAASTHVSAQIATKVDFRRDIQPLLQAHCIECHGPDEQAGGFRFDRRGSVRKVAGRLQPGSSATSRVYLRLVNNDFGSRMPRDSEQLHPEQIALIRTWIDQGAEWPDDRAGEDPPPPPPDPIAIRMIAALRGGDDRALARLVRDQPQAVNQRGAGGSTPLMFAALYGDERSVRLLLDRGADPNIANEAGATALMWAADDARIAGLLLDRKANPNAISREGYSALSVAAGRRGGTRVVKLLLDRGASPSPHVSAERFQPLAVPLAQAAGAGNAAAFRLLVERGADVKKAGALALVLAAQAGCATCVDALMASLPTRDLTAALVSVARLGDSPFMTRLVDRGADVNGRVSLIRRDIKDRTALMLAASSDFIPTAAVGMLIARGAEVNAVGPEGETALDLARRHGDTAVVRVLIEAGARAGRETATDRVTPRRAPTARAAFERVMPMLQRSDATFTEKTGCVSCHHNTLTAMTVAAARTRQLPIDEGIVAAQRKVVASVIEGRLDRAALGNDVTDTASNMLSGLAADGYAADVATDVIAHFLKGRQAEDGRWRNFVIDHRPPIQHTDIDVTANVIRALRIYAPPRRQAEYQLAIRRAATWLMTAETRTTDQRAFQLLGLVWAGVAPRHERIRSGARALLSEQRPDGGWAQLPTLTSDAYATGQALVALLQAGALRPSDLAYRRGVDYLLDSQLADGSWYVKSRALAFQPYFESGFPHGTDQWVSMAATNWAAMALAAAATR
jgi:ankyrin repeat protein/mono/diheme cytochrome c family protein